MIFIVSIILMFCFALSAVFIGFAPNAYKLTYKDFVSKAIQNAELEAMQRGDVYLRAGVLNTNTTIAPNTNTTTSLFTYTVDSDGDRINIVNITSNITVAINSTTGVESITVSADK
ncbi:MAG: hypothetical protein Q7J72_08355 [Candidatus Omnitrophota bacterium]|nr:hypothetical protein [Candidatus Omnitrophota bacterium]